MKKLIALLLAPLIYLSAAHIEQNNISIICTLDTKGSTARDVALSSDGKTAYVAAEDAGVLIFDVSPKKCKKGKKLKKTLGSYDSNTKNAYAVGITLSSDGTTAYVANYRAGLLILDVKKPKKPKKLKSFETYEAWDVTLSSDGKTAYVADDIRGLKIIDVNNSSKPELLSTFDRNGSIIRAWNVTLSADGNTAYLSDDKNLSLIDVSNPSDPKLKGTFSTGAGTLGIALSSDGKTAYVANYSDELGIIDVNNSSAPTLKDTVMYSPKQKVFDDNTRAKAYDVALSKSADGKDVKAYVADFNKGLVIIDVRNPHEQQSIIPTPGSAWGVTLSPDGTKAYVADYKAGVAIFDLSKDPLSH